MGTLKYSGALRSRNKVGRNSHITLEHRTFRSECFLWGGNPLNKTRFFYYSFDMGNYAYGSVYAENEVSCTAEFNCSRVAESNYPGERFQTPGTFCQNSMQTVVTADSRRFLKE